MLLLVDNFDSFTHNLYDYFVKSGAETEVLRNNEIDVATIQDKYTGIILSPGPGKPSDAGVMMEIIDKYHNKLPIFGVCLGMQAIGEYFGANLERAHYPMHGKMEAIGYTSEHPMFNVVSKPLEVCRYHSLVLENILSPLENIAKTANGESMAIAHQSLPIWGVQFHPEAILTPQGLTLINNWLSCFSLQDHKNNL